MTWRRKGGKQSPAPPPSPRASDEPEPISTTLTWSVQPTPEDPLVVTANGIKLEQWGLVMFTWAVKDVVKFRDYLNELIDEHTVESDEKGTN